MHYKVYPHIESLGRVQLILKRPWFIKSSMESEEKEPIQGNLTEGTSQFMKFYITKKSRVKKRLHQDHNQALANALW